jgi:hypothetical protein
MAEVYDENVPRFKVVLLGDTGVGKSEFGNRYLGKRAFETGDSPYPGAPCDEPPAPAERSVHCCMFLMLVNRSTCAELKLSA